MTEAPATPPEPGAAPEPQKSEDSAHGQPPVQAAEPTPAESAPEQEQTPSTESQSQQPEEAQAQVPTTESAPQPHQRGWLYRLLNFMFTPHTRFGRAMRKIVLWLATFVGLVSLGLVAGYLLFFQPLDNRLNLVNADLAAAQQQIQQQQTRLTSAVAERDSLQKAHEAALSDLARARAEVDSMQVVVSVNDARLALAKKDGAAAKAALEQAQADLAKALPVLAAHDASLTEVIKSRLELALKELVIDPQAAEADLEKLQTDLAALQNDLFK